MIINETITPAEAGRRLGRSQVWVQDNIRNGTLWFCIASKGRNGRWHYTIPKEAFDRFMRGELHRPEVMQDALRLLERILAAAEPIVPPTSKKAS